VATLAQLTLHDGTNVLVDADTEYDTKDSIVVDNESKDVVAHFEYERAPWSPPSPANTPAASARWPTST